MSDLTDFDKKLYSEKKNYEMKTFTASDLTDFQENKYTVVNKNTTNVEYKFISMIAKQLKKQ